MQGDYTRVREELEMGPLVTPLRQMVDTQATVSLITGGRYKMLLIEVTAYTIGDYGVPHEQINADVLKKALGNDEPIQGRFADTLEPAFEKTKESLRDLTSSEEDILSYLAFPQIAEEFIRNKKQKPSVEQVRNESQSEPI